MTHPPKILLFSDLHLTLDTGDVDRFKTNAKARQALDQALTAHPDAAQVILLGDLANTGHENEYAILHDIFASCPLPVTCLMGNCDNRDAFATAFPDHVRDANGFVQDILDLGSHRLVCLDTLDPDPDPAYSGILCGQRMAWLEQALSQAGDRHVTVLCHHPLTPVGMVGGDKLRLRNGDTVVRRLADAGVRVVINGHLHRVISGNTSGVPYSVLGSTGFGIKLDTRKDGLAPDPTVPGMYHVLLLAEDGPRLHTEFVAPLD